MSDWLICYPSTQILFERALPKISKTKMASERAFGVDFALLLVLEFQENVGGFLLCPPFQNGRRMLGDKAQTFRSFTGKEPFPSLLLVAVCRVEKCSATGTKNKLLPHVCNVYRTGSV